VLAEIHRSDRWTFLLPCRCQCLGISACATDRSMIGYLLAHAMVGDIPVARTTKGFIRTNVRAFERLTTP